MPRQRHKQGRVVRTQSGFFTVQVEEGRQWVCKIRGRLKRGPRSGDIVALGDYVEFTPVDAENGIIERVLPRERALVRLAPTPRGTYQQVIIANPDQVVFVFACAQPQPRLGMLDRFLVIAEKQEIPVLIVANKVDLVGEAQARQIFGVYPSLGYPVLYTSVPEKRGIEALRAHLQGYVSALAGPSGVGKSSLLNAVQPGLGLAVSHVSEATQKGRHTTVVRALFPLEGGGYVADTPGIKSLGLWDIEPEELDGYFPEMRTRVHLCTYNDCAHLDEPGCAVRAALESGEIAQSRYRSYLRMRFGEEVEEWEVV
ncbi:MAG: ribosome small subunit-dependent GTPase A [Anaerolineae bacterium]|nr:MAG: ribosome small subunit-dependent GTPase A [Anaerolineae bacterium]